MGWGVLRKKKKKSFTIERKAKNTLRTVAFRVGSSELHAAELQPARKVMLGLQGAPAAETREASPVRIVVIKEGLGLSARGS